MTTNPWVDWSGGERPVAEDQLVEVVLRDGTVYSEFAYELAWAHGRWNPKTDIVKYRKVDE